MTIKAISTKYNGYKFRSRLEARWAYFLDLMYIEYQYELEGFEVSPDNWYLPDFRLSDAWLEIKHKNYDVQSGIEKVELLVRGRREKAIIVFGDPLNHLGVIYKPHFILPGFRRRDFNFMDLPDSYEAAIAARETNFK